MPTPRCTNITANGGKRWPRSDWSPLKCPAILGVFESCPLVEDSKPEKNMIGKPPLEIEARFNAILEEYGKFLRRTVVRLCPKDLGLDFNDIEQEARLRLWRALQSEREITDLASYLYKIAATATIDALRRAKAKREQQFEATHGEEPEAGDLPAPLVSHPGHSPERLAEQQELMRKIAAALARLAENRRRAVGLYLEGMTGSGDRRSAGLRTRLRPVTWSIAA